MMSTLTVRKLNIDLSRGFGRHWLGGDAYRTHYFNALSMTFPIGEQNFIDSVRAAPQSALADPVLRAQVRDFIGQEASHRFVHAQFNRQLEAQGLFFAREGAIVRRLQLLARLGPLNRLAVTCALEHHTATLAAGVLTHPHWMGDAEPDLRVLWTWHAAEETEHKAVAFDVYTAAGGGYWRRVLWFLHATLVLTLDLTVQSVHNLQRAGELWRWSTWRSAALTWFGRDGLAWYLAGPLLRYLAPSFHPWRHDNLALARRWLAENAVSFRAVDDSAA
jgi:predicted metal-dependent hydrolase